MAPRPAGHAVSAGGSESLLDDDSLGAVSMPPATESERAKAGRQAAAMRANRQLIGAMIFCFIFMIAEVIGGYYAHSLAIMTE